METLLTRTAKMMLQKELTKYGIPVEKITAQLIDDLFPLLCTSAASPAGGSAAMLSAVEKCAVSIGLALSGDKTVQSVMLMALLHRHGLV